MYEISQTDKFREWLGNLRDKVAKGSIVRRIERLAEGNFGDSKSVGDNVFELRIDCGQGYRVYFTNIGNKIVFLLLGGNKSTQSSDIKAAKYIAKEVINGVVKV